MGLTKISPSLIPTNICLQIIRLDTRYGPTHEYTLNRNTSHFMSGRLLLSLQIGANWQIRHFCGNMFIGMCTRNEKSTQNLYFSVVPLLQWVRTWLAKNQLNFLFPSNSGLIECIFGGSTWENRKMLSCDGSRSDEPNEYSKWYTTSLTDGKVVYDGQKPKRERNFQ